MKINLKYLLLTVLLFTIEVCIARNFYNKIIRNYIGDVLVIMLMYCFIRSFFRISVNKCLLFVLLFACGIETLQYFNLLNMLGLQNSKMAALILGRNFS